MLSRRERRLLVVLLWTCVVAACGTYLFLYGEERRSLAESERATRVQLAKLGSALPDEERVDAERLCLREAYEAASARFYEAGETDPYRFGILIRDLLVAEGLSVLRTQTVSLPAGSVGSAAPAARAALEFAVSGDLLAVIRFLERVSSAGKAWAMPLLSLKRVEAFSAASEEGALHPAGRGEASAVFRVSYETLP